MKIWRAVLLIKDDGLSDKGVKHLSKEEIKAELELDGSFISGLEVRVDSISEVKCSDDKH